MSKAKVIAAKERYAEAANRIVENSKQNFDSRKLESSEVLKFIVASDIACLTVSDKRAYIDGNYIGGSSTEHSDVINLEAISSVETCKKHRSSIKRQVVVIILTIIVSVISFMLLYDNYNKSNDTINSEYQEYNHDGNTDEEFYRYYNSHSYLSSNEIEARGTDIARNEAGRLALEDAKSKAKKSQEFDIVAMFVIVCVGSWLLIHEMLKIHRSQYMVLSINTANKQYALEIKDIRITEQIKSLVLVANSNIQKDVGRAAIQNVSQLQQNDKISKLTELSTMYQQGLIQRDEFESLKKELLGNKQ